MPAPKTNNLPHLLTIKDAAAVCQVSEKTIRRWIDAKELPAARLGAQWRLRPKDLDLFIREHLNW